MIEKNVKSRIQNKHDIEANWAKAENFVPLIGEIIVYDIDENYDYERIKIGDGVSNVNILPFSIEEVLTVELDETVIGTPNTINADSLGGKSADEFALRSDVESLKNTPFIPQVSTEDNGKFLRVVDGVWAAVALPNAEGVGF